MYIIRGLLETDNIKIRDTIEVDTLPSIVADTTVNNVYCHDNASLENLVEYLKSTTKEENVTNNRTLIESDTKDIIELLGDTYEVEINRYGNGRPPYPDGLIKPVFCNRPLEDDTATLYRAILKHDREFDLIKLKGVPMALYEIHNNNIIPVYVIGSNQFTVKFMYGLVDSLRSTEDKIKTRLEKFIYEDKKEIEDTIKTDTSTIQRYIEQIFRYKKKIYSNKFRLKSIENEGRTEQSLRDFMSQLEEIERLTAIKSVNVEGEQLVIRTKELGINANSEDGIIKVPIGKVTMRINNVGFGDKIRIKSDLPNDARISSGTLGSNLFHPHIYDSGDTCLGGFVTEVNELLNYKTLKDLVYAMLMFLQSVNPSDEAGADILRLSQFQDYEACNDCGMLLRKDNEYGSCPKCGSEYKNYITEEGNRRVGYLFTENDSDIQCHICNNPLHEDEAYEDHWTAGQYYCYNHHVVTALSEIASIEDEFIRRCHHCREHYDTESSGGIEFIGMYDRWVCETCRDTNYTYLSNGELALNEDIFLCPECDEYYFNDEAVEHNGQRVCPQCQERLIRNEEEIQEQEQRDNDINRDEAS